MNKKDRESGTQKEKTEREVEMQRVRTKKYRIETREKEETQRKGDRKTNTERAKE